ncbi:HNH endonuclease, partial [Actinomyces sp. MRS3W]|nr:HNH endonuclease [Actinomyces sp. MRS3W]
TCLCQAHHRLKHTPGWTLTRTPDGALAWTTPTGARYRRHPDGAVTMLPRRVGPRQHTHPGGPVSEALSRAITPAVLDRLNRGLDNADTTNTTTGWVTLISRGPRPGERAGDFETTPYPPAIHALGLAPLLDEIPPF